jgi:hypothetical protein
MEKILGVAGMIFESIGGNGVNRGLFKGAVTGSASRF